VPLYCEDAATNSDGGLSLPQKYCISEFVFVSARPPWKAVRCRITSSYGNRVGEGAAFNRLFSFGA
jgi:hypothetical protein